MNFEGGSFAVVGWGRWFFSVFLFLEFVRFVFVAGVCVGVFAGSCRYGRLGSSVDLFRRRVASCGLFVAILKRTCSYAASVYFLSGDISDFLSLDDWKLVSWVFWRFGAVRVVCLGPSGC